jgi:hypothetical protein
MISELLPTFACDGWKQRIVELIATSTKHLTRVIDIGGV